MLVRQIHLDRSHAGEKTVVALLRESVWVPRAKKLVHKLLSRCMRCRRFASRNVIQEEPPLPLDRIKDARVFEVVGVDLTGHLFLKDGRKVWLAIFTCGIYRAIHLELVESLSTEAFLMALRRFVAGRGRPAIIYSDQGLHFQGTNNLLNGLDWQKNVAERRLQKICWKFNPAAAPWFGGFWERLIRSVREVPRSVLGRAVLNFAELETAVYEAEAVVNSRPLTCIGEKQDELLPLTPQMFVDSLLDHRVPDFDGAGGNLMQKRFQYRVKLMQELRSRFRKEYLSTLVRHKKKTRGQVSVGDVVLVSDDLKKRIDWRLAKVIKLYPGRDGISRVAVLKTQRGEMVRPVQRLYPLELETIPEGSSM